MRETFIIQIPRIEIIDKEQIRPPVLVTFISNSVLVLLDKRTSHEVRNQVRSNYHCEDEREDQSPPSMEVN